jgi:predicted N-acetyltransferase YhbS
MTTTFRRARPEDAEACGRICYDAFCTINREHNFPPEFPNVETAIGLLTMAFSHPRMYAVVAERDGQLIGSNVQDERSPIAGIGPISVDPKVQNAGVGRHLMEVMLERVREQDMPGVRLVQAAFHNRSLSLYTKLGFDTREPLSCMQGPALASRTPGYDVRPCTGNDVEACNRLCIVAHGHTREGELRDAIRMGAATVVEHGGRIVGYATGIAFFSHAMAESNEALKALIAAAPAFIGPGFLLPTRNAELMRWCFDHGLKIVQPMTLMTKGLYSEPRGAYLPSILF